MSIYHLLMFDAGGMFVEMYQKYFITKRRKGMKMSKKILCALLCVTMLIGCIFMVFSFGASETTSDGLYIPKQNDTGYYPASPVVLDYPATNYKALKLLEQIPQTVEAWVFIPSTLAESKSAGVIIGNYPADTSYGEAFINYEIYAGRHPRIWWADEFAYNQYDIIFENTTVAANEWTHVTFVYDNSTGIASCYVNGELSESKYFYPALDSGVTDYAFVLGGDRRTANTDYFRGELKDVAMFSTVRSAAQIAEDYEGVAYSTEGLMCYYDVDATSMNADIPDKTGNGYDLKYSKTWLSEAEMAAIRESYGESFEYDYSFAVFGDTQTLTQNYPNMLVEMYQWVADNKDEKKIVYSLGLGDITDDNGANKFNKTADGKWVSAADGEYDEWDVAKEAICKLNGIIPYSLVRGNHDITNSKDTFNKTFSDVEYFTSQFEGENGGKYTDTGVKDPVTSATVSYANTWCTFKINIDGVDVDYLFLNLDYGASDDVLAWASSVISREKYANHRVVISTHCYLTTDGTTEDAGDPTPPSIMRTYMNNGDDMWDEFVSKHPNIYMMLSGHITSNEILVNRVNANIDGKINVVTEMLINPQAFDSRLRSGMVAMFYFDESENKVAIEWYSPARDAYFMTANQFVIDLDSPGFDRVPEKWDGTTLTKPEGEGTEQDPYIVSSPSHLLWMSKQIIDSSEGTCFAGKYFRQVCDIDLDGKAIQSIGYYFQNFKNMSAFSGNYDGGGYSIKNGTIASVEGNHAFSTYYGHGLFGVIYGAVIENVVLEDIEVVGRGVTGAIVGRAASPEVAINDEFVNFNIISGCVVKDSVKITTLRSGASFAGSDRFDDPLKAGRVGSICGMAYATLIEGCTSDTDIKITGDFTLAGGIAGTAGLNTVISNTAFTGSITLVDNTALSDSAYGGIVGAVSPGALTTDELGRDTGVYGNLSINDSYATAVYSYTGEAQTKTVTYGAIIGYSTFKNGTYTANGCLEEKSDAIDSAIAAIKTAGTDRIWFIGTADPTASAAEGSRYLDNKSGKYYAYSSGEWVKLSELGMATNSLETPYGDISAEYIASPMVVFKYENGAWVFDKGYELYGEMNDGIRRLTDANTAQKAVCYFRGDVTINTNSTNLAWNLGTIIFDLGGNTVYQANSKHVFPAVAKFGNSFSSDPARYSAPGYFEVKNGNIVLNDKGLFEMSAYGSKYNENATDEMYKKFYYTFTGVNISLAPGSNLTELFGAYADSPSVCNDGVQKSELFAKFDDNCTIDISNAEKTINLFNANDTKYEGLVSGKTYYATNSITHIEVGAIEVISDSASFTWYTLNTNNGSSVVFNKGTTGAMATLTVPSSVTPATDVNLLGSDGFVYDLYKQADTDPSVYSLYTPSTPYGDIGSEFASVEDYPFAVFKLTNGNWVFPKGYATFSEATYGAISSTKGGYKNVVYVRRNVETNYPSNNINWNIGTLVIDLGGHTVTPTEYFLPAYAKFKGALADNAAYDDPGYYEIINGEIKLGNYGLFKIGALGANYDNDATDENYKQMYFNFDNVKISLKEGSTLESITGYYDDKQNTIGVNSLSSKKMGIHITYGDGCIFDITNATKKINLFNANDSVTDGVMGQNSAGKDYYAVNTVMNIEVGAVKIVAKDNNFTWYTVNSANKSSVVFKSDANGDFFKLTVPEGTAISTTATLPGGNGASYTVSKIKTENGNDIYSIPSLIVTPYGKISSVYEQYKMIIFVRNADGSYSLSGTKGYNTFAEGFNAAQGLTKSNASADVVLYFLGDVISETYVTGNIGYNLGKITIDLNGKTLTAALNEPLVRAYAKYNNTPASLPDAYYLDGYYAFKNGQIVLGSEGLFRIGMEGEAYDTYVNDAPQYKTLHWTFDDIDIKLSAGATLTSLLGEFNESSHCGKYVKNSSKKMGLDVTFKDNCTIDITNAAGEVTLFNANDIEYSGPKNSYYCTNSIVKVTVGAIEIMAGSNNFKVADINTNNGSSVTFVKGENGKYATLVLPEGVTAPVVEANGGSLGFVKVGLENGNGVYTLAPADALTFVPKMSLTLDRDLILNVYIPAKDYLVSFTLDGKASSEYDVKETTIGGEDYYLVSTALDAKTAARDVVLRATVKLGEKSATGTFTFGVIKYAEKILADGSAAEQTLVRDVLSYVRAAYTYFKTDDAATVSKINTILGENYDTVNAPAIEGSSVANAPDFKSVTFVLDGTPAMRFYLADGADASKYAFYIDGTRVKTETSEDGKYIDIDVYAYALCETVTYTVDGAAGGSFHINAYYEWSKTQNNENLTSLVARFWKYLQSARAYRDSVIDN